MEDKAPVAAPRARRTAPAAQLPPPDQQLVTDGAEPTTEAGRAQEFHCLYRSAYEATVEAQNLDEDGVTEQAFKCYEKALQLIDKAVCVAHKGGFASPEVNKIDELTLKIRLTRKEILERVSDLQHQGSGLPTGRQEYLPGPAGSNGSMVMNMEDLPPAYSEIGNDPISYNNLAAALDEIASEQAAMANPLPVNAREVFSIGENVQIYFISAEDNVSAPSYPSFLRLVVMEQQQGDIGVVASSVPAFLQVGDWTYPLIPLHSPVFRSTEGIYIFPDLTQNLPGSYVGLILPENIPIELRKSFEETLLQLVGVQQFPDVVEAQVTPTTPTKEKKPVPPRPSLPPGAAPVPAPEQPSGSAERRLSTKIAEGLITGAEAVSRGIIFGATKTSNLLDKGAAYIQSKIEPAKEKPVIKPEYKKGMKTAKTVSGKAVQISGYVVTQVGHATLALGRYMAPHVHKASTKFLARTVAYDEVDASRKVDQVLEVTTGAVYGVGTVYFGLEHAAKTLVKSLANNTVQIVQHKYGEEAGEFAGDTAATAGNAALTAWNTKNLAPKSVAKKVAKNTGKVIIKQYQEKKGIKGPTPNSDDPSSLKGPHSDDNNSSAGGGAPTT